MPLGSTPRPAVQPVSTRVWRLPGVYRPQEDTFLLAGALRAVAEEGGPTGPASGAVLDFCTGTGVLAMEAARLGARVVTAVDLSPRAVVTARLNAYSRGLAVRVVRGGLGEALLHGPFDVVIANPPYVPHDGTDADARWDAGADGRSVLDPLCRALPGLLAPGGTALVVHSEFSGVDATMEGLDAVGLDTRVVVRERIPFGPVVRGRVGYLRRACGLTRDTTDEEVVVIRADRTA